MRCPFCDCAFSDDLCPFSMCPGCGQPIESRYVGDGKVRRDAPSSGRPRRDPFASGRSALAILGPAPPRPIELGETPL